MSKEDTAVSRTELFVRLIPLEVTSEQLSAFFSDFAPVKHATVVSDPQTGESKGFGFVSFSEKDDAQTALEQSRKATLAGRKLAIDYARPRERKAADAARSTERAAIEKRRPRLIIRNLPWSVRNADELKKIFSRFGEVSDAYIPRKAGGRMSGYAFVVMRKVHAAKRAVEECKELKIRDRAVNVDFAVEKSKYLDNQQAEAELNSDDDSESEDESESAKTEPKKVKEEVHEDESGDDDEGAGLVDFDAEEEDEISDGSGSESESEDDDDDEHSEEDDETSDGKPRRRPATNDRTIFVRNIPYDATEEDLVDHFEEFGPVQYALPVFDKALNQPKGVAFVAFRSSETCEECVRNAPNAGRSGSMLLADDVDKRYVYEGRILAISQAVDRGNAEKLKDINSEKRKQAQGKEPSLRDKRNTYLLNEGRITADSKLAENMPPADLEIREKSYNLRKKQLATNPSLHLSLTRLAVRNIPRLMNERGFKALARKAIVEFAKEVKNGTRQPLTKEEIKRSIDYQKYHATETSKKHGVVRQAKIITEHKVSGEEGRSRGYGFIQFRNHKSALMALRWLNAHTVTKQEILEGYLPEEREKVDLSDLRKRQLVVEFALDNAQVVKRRAENHVKQAAYKRRREETDESEKQAAAVSHTEEGGKKGQDPDVARIIAKKRRTKKLKRSG